MAGRRCVLLLLLIALAACAGTSSRQPADPSTGGGAARGPDRVVAEFLDAANRRDRAAMASRFGTEDGPIGERGGAIGCAFRRMGSWIGLGDRCLTRAEVELRMDLVAAVLAHESYRLGTREDVAGRGRRAARIEVELDTAAERDVTVPFVLVRTGDGRWLVEEVDLERLMG